MCEFWTPTQLRLWVATKQGREIRWVLLRLLIAVLIGEQLLALRLSYHPEVAK